MTDFVESFVFLIIRYDEISAIFVEQIVFHHWKQKEGNMQIVYCSSQTFSSSIAFRSNLGSFQEGDLSQLQVTDKCRELQAQINCFIWGKLHENPRASLVCSKNTLSFPVD